MRSIVKIIMPAAALALMWLCHSPALAQYSGCQQLIGGRAGINDYLCPPPLGDMGMDQKGNFMCGPGQCVVDMYGRVRCASTPGGQALVDSTGKAKCVGGCVDGSYEACVTPSY